MRDPQFMIQLDREGLKSIGDIKGRTTGDWAAKPLNP